MIAGFSDRAGESSQCRRMTIVEPAEMAVAEAEVVGEGSERPF